MHSDSAKGSALSTDDLLKAYTLGYFPMSEGRNDPDVFWVLPEHRGAMPIRAFRMSRSIRKVVRQDLFEVRTDTNFRGVMMACAETHPGREDTWINERILETYCELFEMGFAHSVETWLDGQMVGGLYGVSLGGAFFGESMFSRATNASKVALVHLAGRLIAGDYRLLDTQFYTEHLSQFGVEEIPKITYQKWLDDALSYHGDFYALPQSTDGSTILQSITQTS
mgnify:CR=1 FL=1